MKKEKNKSISSEIGKRLKEVRQTHKLKQADMSKIFGISVAAYSKIETGINELTAKHLLTLKREFEVSIDWLLFGDDTNILKGFGRNEEDVNAMLEDMQASRTLLHSILSQYYGLVDKALKKSHQKNEER